MFRSLRPAAMLVPCLVLGLACATLIGQEPKTGFADQILGRWDLTVKGATAEYPSWVDIHLRKETQLQGRFVGQSGSSRNLTRVEYRDGVLEFAVAPQYEKQQSELVFTGRLAADRLEGTTKAPDGTSISWTGARAPALLRDAAPTWGAAIDLFDGTSTAGWRHRGSQTCWKVEGQALMNSPKCV